MKARRLAVAALGALLAALPGCERRTPGIPTAEQAGPLDSAPEIVARQADAPAAQTEDAALAGKVSAALSAAPDLDVEAIRVRARDGVVTLQGVAGSRQDSRQADVVAMGVSGVRSVRNELALHAD